MMWLLSRPDKGREVITYERRDAIEFEEGKIHQHGPPKLTGFDRGEHTIELDKSKSFWLAIRSKLDASASARA
jgi:hypothetical protein